MSEAEQAALYAQAIMSRDRTIAALTAVLESISTPHCILCGCKPHVDGCPIGAVLREGKSWEPPRCTVWLHPGTERTGSRCCLRLGHIGEHVSERKVQEVKL